MKTRGRQLQFRIKEMWIFELCVVLNDRNPALIRINLYTLQIATEDEEIDSKYTLSNCLRPHYADFIWNH